MYDRATSLAWFASVFAFATLLTFDRAEDQYQRDQANTEDQHSDDGSEVYQTIFHAAQDTQLFLVRKRCYSSASFLGFGTETRTMIDDVISELQQAITKAQESLTRDLAKLRTGRAHPGMLDNIKVDYYGARTPLTQMANVSVPEPRMLSVKPWDKTTLQQVEKAIRDNDLGLNPQPDGDLIRVPVPPLTEERRKDLTKVAKKLGEDAKVAIRKARHDANDVLSGFKKDGDMGEDDVERGKKKVDEQVGVAGTAIDGMVQSKEKEIMQV